MNLSAFVLIQHKELHFCRTTPAFNWCESVGYSGMLPCFFGGFLSRL